MFCYQCEETVNGKGCTVNGVCGKNADVSDLQDQLIYLCKHIAKSGKNNEEENVFIMESLFATVTNVNFDAEYFESRIKEGQEVLDKEVKLDNSSVLDEKDEDKRALKELLVYGLKGLCAYLDHAYVLKEKDEEIFQFVRKALVATLEDKSLDELIALVLECGSFGVKTMARLDKANTSCYGNPEPTQVNIGVGTNPGILISGHDLKDMEELLEQTDGTGVDVYTHGEMLPANSYPAFKKFSHLKGNYGGSWWKQDTEFESFNGPILMTTNCLVPPKESYKDRVYVTGLVRFSGLKTVADRKDGGKKDFSALIEHAKKCKSPAQIESGEITGGFAHATLLSAAEKIINLVKQGKITKFVVMGGCDGRYKSRDYYTEFAKALPNSALILTAGCAKFRYNKLDLGDIEGIPRIIDAGQCNDSYSLVYIALKLKEALGLDDINKLPISYNIAWYEQKAVLVLLALLSLGVKNIHLGPRLPAFISPNVLNVLVEKFAILPISTVEEDMAKLMN